MITILTVTLFVIAVGVMLLTILAVMADYHLVESPYDGERGDVWNIKVRLAVWLLFVYIPFLMTNDQLLGLGLLSVALASEVSLFVCYRRKLFGGEQ